MNIPKTVSPLRILLVEDKAYDVKIFQKAIENSGTDYIVKHVSRADEALNLLQADPSAFDLLVTDHQMPGMTGLALCQTLLAQQVPIPIVLLTGTGSEVLAVAALKAGVDDYLVKDIDGSYMDLLPLVLSRVVEKYRDRIAKQQAEIEREQLISALNDLNEATQSITADLALEQVLQAIAQAAQSLIKVKYTALGIHDGQGHLSEFLTVGITEEERLQIGPAPIGRGLLGFLLHQGQSLIIDDIATHSASAGFPNHHPMMHSLLGVPIFAKGQLIGALYLSDKENGDPFNETDQKLVEMLARHAANAIENARLHDQTQRIAVLEERDRFAQDLHDGIIQSIYGVGLALEQVKADIPSDNQKAKDHMGRCLTSLANVIQELRSYIFDLRPQAIVYQGLKARLEGLIAELQTNLRLPVQAEIEPNIDQHLSEEQARHIFHICHEALSNAARHARAKQIVVSLSTSGDLAILKVSDDGVGFERPPSVTPGHRGLANIQTRVSRIGAIFDIDSVPQEGTRITVTFRYAKNPQ